MAYMIYEDLEVYKRARALALALHKHSLTWPKIEQFGGMADQLRRSSKSICANLAEGLAKNTSVPDKCRFIQMAMGSTQECRVWLDFCLELEYLSSDLVQEYRAEYQDISRMLYGLQQTIKKA